MAKEKLASTRRYNLSTMGSSPLQSSVPTAAKHTTVKDPPTQNTLQIQRLTPTEVAKRCNRELCFNCDEHFQRGH